MAFDGPSSAGVGSLRISPTRNRELRGIPVCGQGRVRWKQQTREGSQASRRRIGNRQSARKHKVPLLLVDGKPLTENVAIQIWIAHNFPKAALLPSDPWQELRAISMLSWCASSIHPLLSRINSPPRVCDVPNTGDSVRRLAVEPLFENYQIAEEILAGCDYFFDHFTAVDAHFFWRFRRGLQFELDVSKFANCVKHHERMKSRSSVQKLLAHERTVQAEFAKAA
jgi:glutathione S-transferase